MELCCANNYNYMWHILLRIQNLIEFYNLQDVYLPDMETNICIAVASFAVLAQPAVAQGANTNPPPSPTLTKSCKEMATRPAPLRYKKRK